MLVPKTFKSVETATSRKYDRSEEWWDPDYIDYTFTAWAKCTNHSCGENIAIGGTGTVTQAYDSQGEVEWVEHYSPNFIRPSPEIIKIDYKWPDEIKIYLREAFSLFWGHRESCAGRIRVALESLLTRAGIPTRREEEGNGVISLDKRIVRFSQKNEVLGAQLSAIKWLGNSGSHGDPVSREDLLDAFELFQIALEEILDDRAARAVSLANKIDARHNPKIKGEGKNIF